MPIELGLAQYVIEQPPWTNTLWPTFVFVVGVGACVGSFINVVAYRLPIGKSIVSPPSACPKCDHKLAWYDNIPVLGWIMLRGKCRYCKNPVSIRYPIVEAITAALFAGTFAVLYLVNWREGAPFDVADTWPVLLVWLTLVGCLIAATIIDFEHYIIPIGIPYVAAITAAVVLPGAWLLGFPLDPWFVPHVSDVWTMAAIGGLVGLGVSLLLLRLGTLPVSFADAEELAEQARKEQEKIGKQVSPDSPEQWLAYPHPRREMLKELLFLLPIVAGLGLGYLIAMAAVPPAEPVITETIMGPVAQIEQQLPMWLRVFGGVATGFLVGGGLVWVTRILGTLAFGKEAMGLGDVHLLAAVGAVVGAMDVTVVFFVAPFMGLLAALVLVGVRAITRGEVRVIPYGPYLAAATLLVMAVSGRSLLNLFGILAP